MTKKEQWTESLDRFIGELDPNMILCGLMGGMAAYGGIIPPFTRILMTVASASGGPMKVDAMIPDKDKLMIAAAALSPMGLLGGTGATLFGSLLKKQLMEQGTTEQMAETEANKIVATATFCSGALEAMLMYKAFSSPETMKAVIGMPGEILKGIGSIVPG
jgi:hypothetical protein